MINKNILLNKKLYRSLIVLLKTIAKIYELSKRFFKKIPIYNNTEREFLLKLYFVGYHNDISTYMLIDDVCFFGISVLKTIQYKMNIKI